MSLCKKAVKTGKDCGGGYSFEIRCAYSQTSCIRDCKISCSGFERQEIERKPLSLQDQSSYASTSGVGTELKKILESHLIFEAEGCGCSSIQSQWDTAGVEWCEQNIESLTDTLVHQANQRMLFRLVPDFLKRRQAKAWIKRAIKNVRAKFTDIPRQ